ncbi:unnamed protein product, partial [Arabidopsis halleri]
SLGSPLSVIYYSLHLLRRRLFLTLKPFSFHFSSLYSFPFSSSGFVLKP